MIKQNLLKTLAVTTAILFFLLTGADMYIKSYGDISQHHCATEKNEEIQRLSDFHKKDSNHTRIMTYNVLSDSIGFEGTPAQYRADVVCKTLNEISPDVCGFQETSRKWFACIYNNTSYKFIHPVRSAIFATMTTLAYNPDTVMPIAFGEQVFKNGNNSSLRRMVWGVFRCKSNNKILI